MALVLIATPGVSDANAYGDVAFGNAYHETHLYASTWNAQTNEAKSQALIWATRLLDAHIEWEGRPVTLTQALRWPRWGVYDADGRLLASDTIPLALQQATAELARHLLTADPTAPASGPLKSLKVGPIALEYGDGAIAPDRPLFPGSVLALIQPFGELRGSVVHLHRI